LELKIENFKKLFRIDLNERSKAYRGSESLRRLSERAKIHLIYELVKQKLG